MADINDPFKSSAASTGGVVDPFKARPAPGASAGLPKKPERTWGEAASDTLIGVGRGALNMVAGLADAQRATSAPTLARQGLRAVGALGVPGATALAAKIPESAGEVATGLAPGTIGREGSAGMQRADQALQGAQSDALTKDQQDLADTKGFFASAGKVLTSPRLLADQVAQQVPNIATMGAGTRTAALQAGERALAQGLGREAAEKATEKVGGTVATGLSTGLEVSQAAQQSYQQALQQPDDVWMANPEYQRMLAGGADPQAAKETIARGVSLQAMATTAPIAAVAGRLAAPFETAAFTGRLPARPSQILGGIAKEATEEGIQEGGSQFAGNLGNRQINPDQSLTEGVAQAAGTGAALGGVMGGGMAAGGVAANRLQGRPQPEEAAPQPAPAEPPPLPKLLAPPDDTPSYGTITVAPDGTAVTPQQGYQRDLRRAGFAARREAMGLTTDVNAARAQHPAAVPNAGMPMRRPAPFPGAAPGSMADIANVVAAGRDDMPNHDVTKSIAGAQAQAEADRAQQAKAQTQAQKGKKSDQPPLPTGLPKIAPPWVNPETGETMRDPGKTDVKQLLHNVIGTLEQIDADRSPPAVRKFMRDQYGLSSQFINGALDEVRTERKQGLTAPAEQQQAAAAVQADHAASAAQSTPAPADLEQSVRAQIQRNSEARRAAPAAKPSNNPEELSTNAIPEAAQVPEANAAPVGAEGKKEVQPVEPARQGADRQGALVPGDSAQPVDEGAGRTRTGNDEGGAPAAAPAGRDAAAGLDRQGDAPVAPADRDAAVPEASAPVQATAVEDRQPSSELAAAAGAPRELPRLTVGKDPDGWVNTNAQASRHQADRLGVTADIEDQFAQGKTARQVASDLSEKLSRVPVEDRTGLVVNVRATLGIPSQADSEGRAEFEKWRAARDAKRSRADAKNIQPQLGTEPIPPESLPDADGIDVPTAPSRETTESERTAQAGTAPNRGAAESERTAQAGAVSFPSGRTPGDAGDNRSIMPANLDRAAHEAATSPRNERPEPTEAQKEAGNYAKGHAKIAGLDISIENPAGSKRRPEWPALKHHYGYFKGTIGRDKDHVDVFLTKHAEDTSRPVFVVDQVDRAGKFDEHKVVMGAATEQEARDAYLANYSKGWTGLGGIKQMSLEQFKAWVKDPVKTRRRVTRAPASVSKKASANSVATTTSNGRSLAATPKTRIVAGQVVYDQRSPSTLSAYFTPGSLVDGYGGTDKVIAFNPPTEAGGAWSVRVVETDANGKPKEGAREREHSTTPSPRELRKALGDPAQYRKQKGAGTKENGAAAAPDSEPEAVKTEARGQPRPMFSLPPGERPQDVPAFRRWFAGSKAVDEHGAPLRVYHGTGEDFAEFRDLSGRSTGHATATLGHFFTADQKLARSYAEKASRGVPAEERLVDAYLAIRNPYQMSLDEAQELDSPEASRAFREYLERQGFDGIHIEGADSWVAFRSSQIKSASENRGTFDPSSPNIYFSNPDRAADQVPVTSVQPATGDAERLWADANELYRRELQGTAVEGPDGRVRFSNAGRTKALATGRRDPLRMGVAQRLGDIAKVARVFEEVEARSGDQAVRFAYAAAPVEIDGKTYAVRLVYRATPEMQGDRSLYTFEGYEVEPGAIDRGRTPAGELDFRGSPGSGVSVADMVAAFNQSARSFSQPSAAAAGGLDHAAAERLASKAAQAWGENAPTVQLVRSASELPAALRDVAGADRAEGIYDGGKVWINTSNIATPERFAQVLAHESLGHFGVERVVGANDWAAITAAVDRLDSTGAGSERMRAVLDEVRSRYPNVDRETFAKEAIAVAAERGVRNSLVNRVIAAVRGWLRKAFPSMAWNESDVLGLLSRADSFLRAGAAPAGPVVATQAEDGAERSAPSGAALFSRPAPDALADIDAVQRGVEAPTVLEAAKRRLAELVPAKLKDASRPTWLGALATRHLTELGRDYFPQITHYSNYLTEMQADRNTLQAEADEKAERARKWAGANRDAATQLFDLMHEATIEGVDPAAAYQPLQFRLGGHLVEATRKNIAQGIAVKKEQMRGRAGDNKKDMLEEIKALQAMAKAEPRRRNRYAPLVERWNQLSPEAQEIYRDFRDAYRARSDAMEQALVDRIEDMRGDGIGDSQKRQLVNRIRQQFEEARLQGVYFPLQRYGKFFLSATKGEDNTFLMFERLGDLQRAVQDMRGRGWAVTAQGMKGEASAKDAPSGTFVADVIQQLRQSGVSEKTQDEIYQLYLQALPELSMRKHSIHRKNVMGFDPDAVRAFAYNMHHGSHQLARLRYSHKLEGVLDVLRLQQEAARKEPDADTGKITAGDALLDELRRRHQWIMNPTDSKLTNLISSVGFSMYLGATPAAALVNLSQTALVSYPYLAARYGAAKAGNYLLAAGRDAIRTMGNIQRVLATDEERQAHQALTAAGAIDKSQAHNLAGIAEGGMAGYNPKWAKAMEVIGWGFHKTEVINREATAIAAFRLARGAGQGFDEAVKFARDAVFDTHFDYSNANRARYMQSGAAKVLLMFRQYGLNMAWALGRMVWNATKGADQDVKRIARRNLAGVLGMSSLFSGALGLPTSSVVMGVLNSVAAAFGDDDEPWDAETELSAFLRDMLGEAGADVILHGPVNKLTGADIAGRVGMSSLFFQDVDKELSGAGGYDALLETAAGPMGGVLRNVMMGRQQIEQGHTMRGIETMLPKALKDVLKAGRYATQGVQSLRGDPIVDNVSPYQVLLQGSGFTPDKIARQYEENRQVKDYEKAIMDRRQALANAYAMAARTGDSEGMAAALAKIQGFNRSNPEVAITGSSIRASVRARAKYSERAEGGVVVNPKLQAKLDAMTGTAAAAQ